MHDPAREPVHEPVREPDTITSETIAEPDRLRPCRVELRRTDYDEETRAPSTHRHTVARLVRRWPSELRDEGWRTVAPIPLTLEQARRLLREPAEDVVAGRTTMVVMMSDGTLLYAFDGQGRTEQVDWDPAADSSTYTYSYRYRCPSQRGAPRYDVDPDDA